MRQVDRKILVGLIKRIKNKFRMKKLLIFATYLLIVSFLFSSCKTLKNRKHRKDVLTLEEVYDSVGKFQKEYKTLFAKCNIKYQNKSKTISLKGNLKILKDSLIWISLSPGLGIEVVRLKCTKDSVFLLDKINKSITKGKYSYIKKLWKIDVDYNSLQSILTNHFFIYPTVADEKFDFFKEFTLKDDSTQIVAYRKTEQSVENLIKLNNSDFSISSYLINDVPNVRSLLINYGNGNFDTAPNFPGKVDIASSTSGKSLMINVNYTRVTLNSSITFPFRVPSSYRIIIH